MTRQPRRGYGLFQLLVVVAVIALLIGMLLPAVQKVREAASRTQSANNLKQIGLAIHNYHDVMGSLPPGVDDKHFSGLVTLLPYVEQDALYRSVDRTTAPDDKANATARATHIKVFLNPRDDGPAPDATAGPTNYMLIAGTKKPLADNDGVFYRDSKVRFTEITDGSSNTIMTLETLKGDGSKVAASVRRQHVRLKKDDLKDLKDTAGVQDFADGKNISGNRGGSWMDGRFLQTTTNATRKFDDDRPDVDCGGEGGLAGPRSMANGVNVGFADGSVRFVSNSVAFETWQKLATRAGGEVVNDF